MGVKLTIFENEVHHKKAIDDCNFHGTFHVCLYRQWNLCTLNTSGVHTVPTVFKCLLYKYQFPMRVYRGKLKNSMYAVAQYRGAQSTVSTPVEHIHSVMCAGAREYKGYIWGDVK